ncbi:phosphotransferase [Paractinoplanes atraurantiacus]|uniref:Phosphotransferase enzyme family protein n=1 Tax=Paractinoplanes atraurantiacus TaxID=1036182 RepID=A0A285IG31_9ACTN|nr:phosphotransferase [Actinoplanes atraurantiacus]SNY46883.1 Phosphotransferase enzyme family protein [Actinoplanes atraurantiacus]
MEPAEQLGAWGAGAHPADAVLRDGVVHKTAGPWTPAVFALLDHLERAGFAGAPRVVGDGYSFVPGESPHPHAWPDEAVAGVGTLLRALHDATSTFTPPANAIWQPNWLRDLGGDDMVIGHCDTGAWNIVGEQGRPDAFIDWEFAGPVDRLWELAETVWLNAQLFDDDVAEMQNLPDARSRARQARAIVDGYGLPRSARDDLVDRLSDVAIHSARHEAIAEHVTVDSTEAISPNGYPILWGITWRARSASWIAGNRPLLRRAMLE